MALVARRLSGKRRPYNKQGGLKPAFLFAGLCLLSFGAAAPPVAIRLVTDPAAGSVEVSGLSDGALRALENLASEPAERAKVFAVFAEQEHAKEVSPMAGEWRVTGKQLRFEPRFPLARGVRYRAEFRAAGVAPVIAHFELPADTTPSTTSVVQIHPSAAVLPENQLKFYVQFSAPMSRGGIYEHIQIRDAAGKVIELAFLELGEELWDPSMTRLTLLIDPGRIKRGVKPLMDVGPVFETGKHYALTVAAGCRDAAGRPLRSGFEKRFSAGPADRTPPDPARWKIHAPAAGTRDALRVEFDEPMERALALRLIDVVAASDNRRGLDGEPALGGEEREWTFVPVKPWQPGQHDLMVATTIEDLAGNNIGKAFDVDVFENVQRRLDKESVRVAFEVK